MSVCEAFKGGTTYALTSLTLLLVELAVMYA